LDRARDCDTTEALTTLVHDWGRSAAHRAAFLKSLVDDVEVQWRGGEVMPAASLVKVLLVEAVLRRFSPVESSKASVSLGSLGATRYPTILRAFEESRKLSLSELCALAVVTSDNPSATYLANTVGINAVNDLARETGLLHTRMASTFTDDAIDAVGRAHSTTAAEMASLLKRLYVNREIDPVCGKVWLWLLNNLRNTRIPALLPDSVRVAHKTGTLESLANDAGVVLADRPYVLVLLTDRESDPLETSQDMAKLSLEVFEVLGGI
jgi:beta-lactamase class A